MEGLVKWFSSKKGYGFLRMEDGKDVFVHFSAIKSSGFKTLNKGDKVTFDLEKTDKGEKAVNVEKVGGNN